MSDWAQELEEGTFLHAASTIGTANGDRTPDPLSQPQTFKQRRVLLLFLGANLWTLVLTTAAVVFDLGTISPYPRVYTGDDLLRLLEPFVTLPLQLFILHESGVFSVKSLSRRATVAIACFAFGAAMYQQGAGFHSASALFKQPVEELMARHSESQQEIHHIYGWTRNVWEHEVGHYMYAAGAWLVSAAHAWAYRQVVLPNGIEHGLDRGLWASNIVLYGITIGSVAIQFPWGSLVALIFLVLYGFGCIGGYLWVAQERKILPIGRRPILQYFLYSYVWALVIVLAWIGKSKGFASRNKVK